MKKIVLYFATFLSSTCVLEAQVSEDKRVVPYDGLAVPINYKGHLNLLVIGQDNRPSILDGSKKTDFVGVIRPAAGVPWKLKTKSGNSFIADFTSSIALSLKTAGFSTKHLTIRSSHQADSARQTGQFEKVLLIVVNEWITDQYDVGVIVHNRTLTYDVTVSVHETNGNEVFSRKFIDPAIELSKKGFGNGDYGTFIPEAVKVELAKILNNAEVKEALHGK